MTHVLAWTKTDGPGKRANIEARFFHFVDDTPYAAGIYLDVLARSADGAWPRIDTPAATDGFRAGAFTQLVLPAWDKLVAVLNGGRVAAFDPAQKAWHELAPADDQFVTKHQLGAFDPERGLLVTWGSHKKQGRKDDTLVHDGKAWRKPKKAAGKWADLDTGYDNLCMYWDPAERAVVRVGVTEVGVFDGATWKQYPLAGGDVLDDWDRAPVVDGERVLIVQRFMAKRDVIRVHRDGDRFVATRVATFPPAVTRAPNSAGSNAAFDACCAHAPTRTLHAFDQSNSDRYVAAFVLLG